jgi:ADP-heptose:LPS heptosyltransferase
MSFKKSAATLTAGAIKAIERPLRGHSTTKSDSILILEYLLPLGCCVHLTPVYEAIKKARPEVTLSVATRGLALTLLRHNPFIDHLIETPDPLTDVQAASKSLTQSLKQRNLDPDCTFTGSSDQRTRIALLALMAGTGWRGGLTQTPQLYHRPLQYQPDRSLIDNNLQLAGLASCPQTHYEPRVFFSQADIATVKAHVKAANPEGKPLVVMVTQNSGGQSTGWHTDRFVQVVRHAHDTLGCAIVYVGTPADTNPVEQIRQQAGGAGTSLTGKTSVTQLAALLAMSDAVVSLDTGTMHVGRAVGVPMVVIGPSWQKPIEWLPLGIPQTQILRGPDRPDVPPNYKLDEVQADQVIAALDDLLQAYPPSPSSREARLHSSTSTLDHLKA